MSFLKNIYNFFASNVDEEHFITLRPLTREIAQSMGHVVWVEEKDPITAFRKMYEGLQKEPNNCAVWANAGDRRNADDMAYLRSWRESYTLMDGFMLRDSELFKKNRQDLAHHYLRSQFASMARRNEDQPNAQRITGIIKQSVNDNFQAIERIMSVKEFKLGVFAINDTVSPNLNYVHTDGSGGLAHHPRTLRILQSLGCPSTCIVDNRNIYLRTKLADRMFGDNRAGPYMPTVLYQTPESSVVIITNDQHPWAPILHSEAITPPHSKPIPRTLTVLDLAL